MDGQELTDQSPLRHALILSWAEATSAGTGEPWVLTRDRPTGVRGRVALADPDGDVFGWATIEDVVALEALGGHAPRFHWFIDRVIPIGHPFKLAAAEHAGPVWVRLNCDQRALFATEQERLTGQGTADFEPSGDCGQVSDDPVPFGTAADEAPAEVTDMLPSEDYEPADPPLRRTDANYRGAIEESSQAKLQHATDVTPLLETMVIELARKRALRFVPRSAISETEARQLLINLRENEIKSTFPEALASTGLLRKSILERLITEPVDTRDDFERLIPSSVRSTIERRQIEAYLDPILQVLAMIS